jgi:hypothetical protein
MFFQVPTGLVRRRSISSQYVRSLTRTDENTKRQSPSLPSLSLSLWATHNTADLRSCPSPANPPSLPAGEAPHPHPRLIPSPSPHPPDLNLEFLLTLETGLLAGVEDDWPRFGSPPGLPCHRFYRPWEPLLAHDIKDLSWISPVTGRLYGRRRARAPAHRRHIRGSPDGTREWTRQLKFQRLCRSTAGPSLHQDLIFPKIRWASTRALLWRFTMDFFCSWLYFVEDALILCFLIYSTVCAYMILFPAYYPASVME